MRQYFSNIFHIASYKFNRLIISLQEVIQSVETMLNESEVISSSLHPLSCADI
jgi:hypothetical protein